MKNKLKKLKLFNKKISSNATVGGWMQIPSIEIADILSRKKFDFLTLDMEHGNIFLNNIASLISTINNNTLSFVRVNKPDASIAKKTLELGAFGIILPMIESAKQFNMIAKQLFYPPIGNRSIGYSTSNKYGEELNTEIKNFRPFLVCMIENKEIVNDLDQLLKSPYLDAVLVGPYDLSSSIGICGDFDNVKYKKIIKLIENKVLDKKIPFGTHIVQPDYKVLKKLIKKGYKFIPFSLDTVLLDKSINL